MKKSMFFLLFFVSSWMMAQEDKILQREVDFETPDTLFREDQFYVSVSYSTWQSQPEDFRQKKFAPAFSIGFLRDMPVNKSRTYAIAAGLGYALNIYNNNIAILQNGSENNYQIVPSDVSFSKDKFTFHAVELPIEFRWRNATPTSYKFWRVHAGFKLSYLFYDSYKLETSQGNVSISNNKDINPLQYGVYLAAGWNTVNGYIYYGLNSYFKSGTTIEGKPLEVNALHMGLIFYIL